MIEITHTELQKALNALIPQIKKPDYIVAIPRGGLWLAQYLAYKFDIQKSKMLLAQCEDDLPECSNILICDDIYDTGKQHKAFGRHKFATLFARDRGLKFPKNLIYGTLISSDEYLWFPWDFGN